MLEQWCEFKGHLINLDNVVMVMPTKVYIPSGDISETPIEGTKFCFVGGQSYDLEVHYAEAKQTIEDHLQKVKIHE